ncbi:hypothetical protein [Streptomyces sp. NPDC094468]|uniref:hypothetical protein n=1 Tax=Streptomyces sp. NPDC094468 TaxID=3366066 RepID=UPI0038244035
MSAPMPRPPGPWRAWARDAVLNPEELAARNAVVAELGTNTSRAGQDWTPKQTPREQLAPFEALTVRAGWTASITDTDRRATLEGFSPKGAAVMVTAVRGRGVNAYVLYPAKRPIWLVTTPRAIEHFLTHEALPAGVRRGVPTGKCQCGKTGRYPTETRAQEVLTEIKIREQLRERRTMAPRRAYRCPDDDRVWHLTRKKTWYPAAPGGAKGGAA